MPYRLATPQSRLTGCAMYAEPGVGAIPHQRRTGERVSLKFGPGTIRIGFVTLPNEECEEAVFTIFSGGRDRGHVVNIGSVNGLHTIGGPPVYGAAKAAVHMIGALLRIDLVGRHIRVTEVNPGRVESEFHTLTVGDAAAAYKMFYEGRRVLDPEDVTAAVLFTLNAPAHVDIGLIEMTPVGQVPGGIAFPERPSL
jgi:NAD(P)-dependent dehydrogenase (short-subunit alcohol dehydrogenase family)